MSIDLSKKQNTMFHVLSIHCAFVIPNTLITRFQGSNPSACNLEVKYVPLIRREEESLLLDGIEKQGPY